MMNTKIITVTLALILMHWVAPLAAQNEVKEQLVVPLSDPGKPGYMAVNLVNGFIHVVGYSGKDVVIDATAGPVHASKERNTETSANGMKRIANTASLDVSAEEKDNRIQVQSDSWRRPVNLTIKVPQRFSLKLIAVNQGDVTVENVDGKLEVSNVNGPIQLTNVSGSVVANTVNGNLVATFRNVTAGEPMAFSTLNGNVDVTFPTSAKANVKIKSDMGEIFSDFDVDVDKSQPKVNRTSQSGMYKINVDDWVYGKINGGGPEMMMKNMNGNIYLRKAK